MSTLVSSQKMNDRLWDAMLACVVNAPPPPRPQSEAAQSWSGPDPCCVFSLAPRTLAIYSQVCMWPAKAAF